MTANELRQKYLKFFEERGHKIIPSASLVPENDPSVLFTTAGMHPLVPFLLGQPHPQGERLVDVQKSLRTGDIDEVGDPIHHTFFEMLGNWSLGDYFKKDAIGWSYEFLTSKNWMGIDPKQMAVSVFAGDNDAPFDEESYQIWRDLEITAERIAKLPKKNNWWGPAGETGPCGPDTEMFVWTGEGSAPKTFNPDNVLWVEVWNDVFMQYNKTTEGKYELLKQKNVDTGMGLERVLAIMNGFSDDYLTELFYPAIQKIEEISGKRYSEYQKEFRIIADHLRAATFVIADGVEPSNKERGYVLRRLIRRATVQLKQLGVTSPVQSSKIISEVFINLMSSVYPKLNQQQDKILNVIEVEITKFSQTLDRGLKELNKLSSIDGKIAFDLFQTYGFPLELTVELAQEKGFDINRDEFQEEFNKHRELSRTASAGMFKGGLADHSEVTTKYHTATHLLHTALRHVLGTHVQQKGSNITAERMRFDFSHPEKLTEEQLKNVEDLINQKIQENLPVTREEMGKEQALDSGALGFFTEKYGDQVNVYTIDNFSKEICGGPHVENTGSLGHFQITKEESAGANLRRIYATLG